MAAAYEFGKVCGVCGADATVVIEHAEKGERVVCDDCTGGHEVIADV